MMIIIKQISQIWVREAFFKKKEKKMTFVILGGGVKNIKSVIFFKVVFKIHFKLF